MKELSIEEKAKRFDEALKEAVIAHKDEDRHLKATLERIFPELKESEDERMIQYFKDLAPFDKADELYEKYGFSHKDAIAWLEKQGGHVKFINGIQVGDKVTRNEDGVLVNLSQLNRVAKHDDKVNPKFHEGEWITNGDYTWKIVEVKPLDYILQSQDGNIVDDTISHVDEQSHSFTIEDAKDGDVLVASDGSIFLFAGIVGCTCKHYVALTTYGDVKFNEGLKHCWENSSAVYPATKEQYDALKKAIADAGYTFDFEKKELKKIESYSLRSIIKDEPSPAIKKVVDSLTAQNKEDEKIEQAHNVETQKSIEWEPQTGDTFRKKGTTSPTYHLCGKREDGITFGFVENREVGIAGGEITIFALKSDYELVERLKPIEDVVEEELNKALQTKVEQQPAWSEEDERMVTRIVESLSTYADRLQYEGFCHNSEVLYEQIDWFKSLKNKMQPQNLTVTDEQLAQAKKDAYNDALDKIEYHSGEPTFDDGWSAAIQYLKKRKPSEQQIEANCDYSEYEDWT